jgi:hypothetical protein
MAGIERPLTPGSRATSAAVTSCGSVVEVMARSQEPYPLSALIAEPPLRNDIQDPILALPGLGARC